MKYIDLTLPITDKIPPFPGDPPPVITTFLSAPTDGWNVHQFTFPTHFATHIDAPYHKIETGKKLTDFPIEHYIGEAVVLDVRGQKEIKHQLEDIKAGDMVFFYTDHIKKIYSDDYFTSNPVVSLETAQKLVEKQVKIVGIDSYSPDGDPFAVHQLLLENEILIIENLSNLEGVVGQRFQCYVMPLKLQDADGAPCRVVAAI